MAENLAAAEDGLDAEVEHWQGKVNDLEQQRDSLAVANKRLSLEVSQLVADLRAQDGRVAEVHRDLDRHLADTALGAAHGAACDTAAAALRSLAEDIADLHGLATKGSGGDASGGVGVEGTPLALPRTDPRFVQQAVSSLTEALQQALFPEVDHHSEAGQGLVTSAPVVGPQALAAAADAHVSSVLTGCVPVEGAEQEVEVTGMPAQEVIAALTTAAVQEAQAIELAASQVDLHRDADQLRAKLDNGRFVDAEGGRVPGPGPSSASLLAPFDDLAGSEESSSDSEPEEQHTPIVDGGLLIVDSAQCSLGPGPGDGDGEDLLFGGDMVESAAAVARRERRVARASARVDRMAAKTAAVRHLLHKTDVLITRTRDEHLERFFRCQRKRNSLLRASGALREAVAPASGSPRTTQEALAEEVLLAAGRLDHLHASSQRADEHLQRLRTVLGVRRNARQELEDCQAQLRRFTAEVESRAASVKWLIRETSTCVKNIVRLQGQLQEVTESDLVSKFEAIPPLCHSLVGTGTVEVGAARRLPLARVTKTGPPSRRTMAQGLAMHLGAHPSLTHEANTNAAQEALRLLQVDPSLALPAVLKATADHKYTAAAQREAAREQLGADAIRRSTVPALRSAGSAMSTEAVTACVHALRACDEEVRDAAARVRGLLTEGPERLEAAVAATQHAIQEWWSLPAFHQCPEWVLPPSPKGVPPPKPLTRVLAEWTELSHRIKQAAARK